MSLLGAGALSLDPPPFSFKGEPPQQKSGTFLGVLNFVGGVMIFLMVGGFLDLFCWVVSCVWDEKTSKITLLF